MSELNKIPLYLRKPIFEKLFNIAEYTNLNKKEKDMYDTDLKRKWDNKVVMAYHEDVGEKRGLEKGRKEGKKEGLEKGLKKGRKEAAQEKEEIVSNLIKTTEFDDARIASLTGVTIKRVQEVRTEIKK